MKRITITLLIALSILISNNLSAQIYAPEGLNMPGAWDGWTNPPTNLILAGESQTTGGQVMLVSDLSSIYQTKFNVASSSGNFVEGTYEFAFTSGPSTNYWSNKWVDVVNVNINSIQTYTYNNSGGGSNNSITLSNNKWYTMNFENTGYADTRAIFMETSSEPAEITSVSRSPQMPTATDDVDITVEINQTKATDENFYVRYTNNNWTSSNLLAVNFTGTTGTATIPTLAENTEVKYYIFSTVKNNPTQDFDLLTINYDKNGGDFYTYTVGEQLTCDGQIGVVTTNPAFPLQDGSVTITFDATLGNGALAGYSGDVYAHTGVITSESSGNNDWQHVVTTWGLNEAMYKFTEIGTDLYELTIPNIRTFYGVPTGEEILKIAMVIRSGEPIAPENPDDFYVARNADGSDMFIQVYENGLEVKLLSPNKKDPLVPLNTLIPVCAVAMNANSITIDVDGNQVHQESANETMYGLYTGDYAVGMHEIVADAFDGTNHAKDTTWFFVRGAVVTEELPTGMKNGVNYIDDNTVTIVLHDPPATKEFAFVIGDFNNWTASDNGYMKRTADGQHFWTTITGLTSGTEYAYQFYIDGELKLADPYCEKVLDPWNDRYIPSTTYPNLKDYPWDQTIGIVSTFETAQTPYDWQIDNFIPSAVGTSQADLVIYELLVRDFTDEKTISAAKDKLWYLKGLGINAIELMPINEFEGNDSWGYNPDFYFAFDKAYGKKDDFKEFVDACHEKGIAVIIDMVLNHSFGQSPLVQMYYDKNTDLVTTTNPWYNVIATHPYSPGYDFNHESSYTKQLTKDILNHWMTEYKVDGFRFDLSKGFTQVNTFGDVGAWGQYDASRIAIWDDYYDYIKSVNSNAYVILEHLSENAEEKELSNYGMLPWGNMQAQFKQATMGFETGSDFSWAYYSNRGFSYPNLVAYMESHDEERLMYENLTFGNSSGGYDIKNPATALERVAQIAPFYLAIPGPKMIWQFGELGYDYSINYCSNGTISEDCRTSAKPVHWEYFNNAGRKEVYRTYQAMNYLKTNYEDFRNGTFTYDNLGGNGKREWISSGSFNVAISGNFGVTGLNMNPSFQHTGTWYNYLTGESFNVSDASGHSVYYEPGDFYVYIDQNITAPIPPTNIPKIENAENNIRVFPNPAKDKLFFNLKETCIISVYNILGELVKQKELSENNSGLNISDLNNGSYILKVQNKDIQVFKKIIIKK